MKRIYNYILLAVMAFASVGCAEDIINPNGSSAGRGDDVQFGLSLSGPETKTIYGLQIGKVFPIYWVNGDKVQVYSPDCLIKDAEYQVSVEGATQNYVDQLTKTGDAGVQWGNSSSATFYSIYPSSNVALSGTAGNVIASLNIPDTQSLTHTLVGDTYYSADMNSVIMYAKTTANKGATVKLNYTPYSTVIEFQLTLSTSGILENENPSLYVESLTLSTPEQSPINIAGDFTLGLDKNLSVSGGDKNSVTLQFVTRPELTKVNTTLKAKMCLMPIGVTSMDDWKVTVNVREGDELKRYTKTISTGEDLSTKLVAGQVHKIILPPLTSKTQWEYKPGEWIPQLPDYKTIYLSELSLPGAWYAGAPTSDEYQQTASIATLWNAGIRAFAVETRTKGGRMALINEPTKPDGVQISGTGGNSTRNHADGINSLNQTTGDDRKTRYGGTSIASLIEDIVDVITLDEYAVLILSYADGGEGAHRKVDYGAWLHFLYSEFNSLSQTIKDAVYQKEITSDTTIEDVLGKLIIKVNVDSRIAEWGEVENTRYSYNDNLPALISYNPFLFQMPNPDFSKPYFSQLYWKTWGDEYRDCSLNMSDYDGAIWCFNSANRTQDEDATVKDNLTPTYEDRKEALNSMMVSSRAIHDRASHNVFFYFNCGGTLVSPQQDETSLETTTTSPTAFAAEMNPWLLSVIQKKMNGEVDNDGNVISASDPSPLGIVMFNQCTNQTYRGPEIIRAIIEMNNKFVLKHGSAKTKSPAPSYSSGMKDSDVAAFGWD